MIKQRLSKKAIKPFAIWQKIELNLQEKNFLESIKNEELQVAQQSLLTPSTTSQSSNSLDIGFKVLKLDTSNLAQWDSTPTEEQGALFARLHEIENSVKSDRTDLDVVYEVMLKLGVPLVFPVQEIQINDKKHIQSVKIALFLFV